MMTLNISRILLVLQPSYMLYLVSITGGASEPEGAHLNLANLTSAVFHQRVVRLQSGIVQVQLRLVQPDTRTFGWSLHLCSFK